MKKPCSCRHLTLHAVELSGCYFKSVLHLLPLQLTTADIAPQDDLKGINQNYS